MTRLIKKFLPNRFKVWLKDKLGYGNPVWWSGNYRNWKEALKDCGGYQEAEILEKVISAVKAVKRGEAAYERDSVLFRESYVYPPIAEALKACVQNNTLHICDFGGSLGSSYFQYRHLFSGKVDLLWSIVEQPHYVEIGKLQIEEGGLKFFYSIDEVIKVQKKQLLVLFSVLQYLPDPYTRLNELLDFQFSYILIDRTGFIDGNSDRLTIQRVPENIYKASYPAWFFSEVKFKALISKNYEIVSEFLNDLPLPQNLEGTRIYWKGFFLKRKNG